MGDFSHTQSELSITDRRLMGKLDHNFDLRTIASVDKFRTDFYTFINVYKYREHSKNIANKNAFKTKEATHVYSRSTYHLKQSK